MTKLSIIVPIYGVEQYLRKCVDSLLAQDLSSSKYEIILVDDESPDACPQICDEYARMSQESRVKSQELPCIRVIHRKNGGLSAARNSGIEAARGEYICFVDSDDYWEPNVLRELMAQIERDNLDVLRFNYRNIDEHGELCPFVPNPWGEVMRTENVSDGKMFLNTRLGYACYAWGFIIRAALVKGDEAIGREGDEVMRREGERFTEGILFEDTDWTPRMLVRAERVADTPKVVYNYMIRQSGITQSRSIEKLHREIKDKITLIGKLNAWYAENHLEWYRGMSAALVISVLKLISTHLYAERDEILRHMKTAHAFPLQAYHMRKKVVRAIRIINISPRLYVWLKHRR